MGIPGNIFCLMALVGCIPLAVAVFFRFEPRHAIIICFFGSVMFLPMAEPPIKLIIYNKITATSMGVLIAIAVFDNQRLTAFRFSWMDIPMVCWIFSGFMASVTNSIGAGFGVKDGLQEMFNTSMIWGVPYFAARLYFAGPGDLLLLCRALFAAGLIYAPLVLYEIKMSPQLHRMIYGYMQHSFFQLVRGGGWRPMVFMQHGLMLSLFMAMAALAGLWGAYTGLFKNGFWNRFPAYLLAPGLVIVTIACKSAGAAALMFAGAATLFISTRLRISLLIWLLLMVPPFYVMARATGAWDGQNLVDLVEKHISEDRAASLDYRMENENLLVEHALKKPVFGWGGWGRARVRHPETGEKIVTDGMWIITLGRRGFFGLISVFTVMLLPVAVFAARYPPALWRQPEYAPAALLAAVVLMFAMDCLPNKMINPIYIILSGGLTSMLVSRVSRPSTALKEENPLARPPGKTWLRPSGGLLRAATPSFVSVPKNQPTEQIFSAGSRDREIKTTVETKPETGRFITRPAFKARFGLSGKKPIKRMGK